MPSGTRAAWLPHTFPQTRRLTTDERFCSAQSAAALATYPPIVVDPKAAPRPVAFAPGDAPALANALSELAAAGPAEAGVVSGNAFAYTSFAAVPGVSARDADPLTPDDHIRLASALPTDELAAAPAAAPAASAEGGDAYEESDYEEELSADTLAAVIGSDTQPPTYTLAVPNSYFGTVMGAELQRVINISGVSPQTMSLASHTAAAPDSGDAPRIVAGEGYSAVAYARPETPAAVRAAGAPSAAPLFRSFQVKRLQSKGGKKRKGKGKKKKGKGKKKKGAAGAAAANLEASGGRPAQTYPRPANAAMGIQALTSSQLQARARQGSQAQAPVAALHSAARGEAATTLPPATPAKGLANQAAVVALLAARPAGSLASTDPVAAAAAEGLLWRSLSRPHYAPKAKAAPAPAPERAPAGAAAPSLAAQAAPAPGSQGTGTLSQGSGTLTQGAARADVPQISAPQRLNSEAATARLPVLAAVDALSVQQQATMLASAPDVALCAGNGFVVEVVNQLMAVMTSDGTTVTPPTALPTFFGAGAPFDRPGFFAQASCVYDAADSKRFFLGANYVLTDQATGAVTDSIYVLATSNSSDPRQGWTGPFLVLTDGLAFNGSAWAPQMAACAPTGCLGDAPALGIDQHGVWVAVNLFAPNGGPFVGPLLVGVSKADLVAPAGAPKFPATQTLAGWPAEPLAFSLMPARTQAGSAHDQSANGTLFVVGTAASLQAPASAPRQLVSWAITNTQSLSGLGVVAVSAPAYLKSAPFVAPDAPGLGLAVQQPGSAAALRPGDGRITGVSYSDGLLWAGASTAVSGGGSLVQGAIYWVIDPVATSQAYAPTILTQGYVALGEASFLNPVVVANARGQGLVAGTVVGRATNLTLAYVPVTLTSHGAAALVHVPRMADTALQGLPAGGQPAVAALAGKGLVASGHTSAATVDEQGAIWVATEVASVPTLFCSAQVFQSQPFCPNWGTLLLHLNATLFA
ncbi:hypothetical protein WJX81_001722 [Elliptochloris bilobata]|uniref:Uncharacterized protein n=1 Tax=Elliptochloris bilobata TaxID=381761 RepID=A0AAW1S0C7_9CHLO